jgi:hypothetical protein
VWGDMRRQARVVVRGDVEPWEVTWRIAFLDRIYGDVWVVIDILYRRGLGRGELSFLCLRRRDGELRRQLCGRR